MAKREKKPTEPATDETAGKSKTGLYVLGAAVAVAVVAGLVYFNNDSGPRDPNAPKVDPEMSALMEAGPLEDIALGSADAPNTIVEYASMTCPHCAHFYTEVFPEVKEKYIDTGKARFIFREFPLDGLALAASMLARCAGNDRFYPVVDGLFETQETWAVPGEDGKNKLLFIAKQAGFSQESYDKCVGDEELGNKIIEQRRRAHEDFGVDATPSFFVNGKRLNGATLKDFETAIDGKGSEGTPPPSG